MSRFNNPEDTIAAPATPEGTAALGIIRISGKKTFEICDRIFRPGLISNKKTHTIHYGHIHDGEEIVDEVMLSVFKSPKSFTTEDSVEISSHGSPYIVNRILEVLIKNGARLADPGEFTLRAFMNGRIDLAQAEAVSDLIAAQNASQLDLALKQMKGGLSSQLAELRLELLNFVSLIELELDFGEEDVEFADRTELKNKINEIINHIKPVIDSFRYGNAIRNGIPVAIIGRPNAGKSSLLNLLLNDERAIVSEIAGTTRDTIEEVLHIGGLSFRFIDTAGIRDTVDTIEKIGIEKALRKIDEASLIIYIFDASATKPDEVSLDLDMIRSRNPQAKILILANKKDLLETDKIKTLIDSIINIGQKDVLAISSNKNNTSEIENLKQLLLSMIQRDKLQESHVVVTNVRHYQALVSANEALETVKEAMESQLSSDILALEIKRALNAIGEITGEINNDEILGNIFGKFCIGK